MISCRGNIDINLYRFAYNYMSTSNELKEKKEEKFFYVQIINKLFIIIKYII